MVPLPSAAVRRTARRALAAVPALVLATATAAGALTPQEMEPHRRTVADVQAVGTALFSWLVGQVGLQGAEGVVRGGRSPLRRSSCRLTKLPDGL
jgi:hypothetical protein